MPKRVSAWKMIIFAFSLSLGVAGSSFLYCQTGGKPANKKASSSQENIETVKLIYTVKGPEIFRAYCAPCHGVQGKGNGPMAPALKAKVPDLTRISQRNKGQFPVVRVRTIIAGGGTAVAHGSNEMPIWGPIFHQVEADQDWGNVRMENLIMYLESIQKK